MAVTSSRAHPRPSGAASPAEVLGAWYSRARTHSHSFTDWFDPAAVTLVEATLGRGSLRSAVETYAAARQRAGFSDDDLLVDLSSLVAVLPEGTVGLKDALATRAGLERVLNRVYGTVASDGEPPHRTHALVVVDVGVRAGRLLDTVADRMRSDLAVDGPVALLAPRRLAVVVDRRDGLARSLAGLRLGVQLDPTLAEVEVKAWAERLPLDSSGVPAMIHELCGDLPEPSLRPAPPVRMLAAAMSALLIVAGLITLDMTGDARRRVLQVAGRAGPVELTPALDSGDGDENRPDTAPPAPVTASAAPAPRAAAPSALVAAGPAVELVPVVSVRPAQDHDAPGPGSVPAPISEEGEEASGPPVGETSPVVETPVTPEPDGPGKSEDAPGQNKSEVDQSSSGNGNSASAPGRS